MTFRQLLSAQSLVILTIFFAAPKDLNAVQPLTLKELSNLCQDYSTHPQQSGSMQCARYIKGFIDGAIAADSGVRNDQFKQKEKTKSYTQRAIDNRIGSRLKSLYPKENSVFCLGDPIILSHVITAVTGDIKKINNQNYSALGAVFQVLKNRFPCTK